MEAHSLVKKIAAELVKEVKMKKLAGTQKSNEIVMVSFLFCAWLVAILFGGRLIDWGMSNTDGAGFYMSVIGFLLIGVFSVLMIVAVTIVVRNLLSVSFAENRDSDSSEFV